MSLSEWLGVGLLVASFIAVFVCIYKLEKDRPDKPERFL